MDFLTNQEGVILIKNIGNKIAKNINITSDWFRFNSNNFDLEIGQSKTVNYVIIPQISSTEDTNKSYNKSLFITGNFNTVTQNFSIFINYANIGDIIGSNGTNSLFNLIEIFCKQNPTICNAEPIIIYKNINNSDQYFNVTYGITQVNGIYDFLFDFNDAVTDSMTDLKEETTNVKSEVDNMKQDVSSIRVDISSIAERLSVFSSTITYIIILIGVITISGILVFLIIRQKRKNILNSVERFF